MTRRLLTLVAILAWLVLPCPATAQPSTCSELIPKDGPYDRIRIYLSIEKRDYLDEYTYMMNFGSHDDALRAGISLGVEVYGVPLALGGQWDSTKRDAWRTEYEHRRKHDVMIDVQKLIAADLLNVEVVRIVAECIQRQSGFWSSLNVIDSCQFSITAGHVPDSVNPPKVTATLIVPKNATCDAFPKYPLPPQGFTSNCKRKDAAAVPLIVRSKEFGDRPRTLPGIAKPLEPTIVDKEVQTTLQLSLSRGQAGINWGPYNCPDCQTLYGIPFSTPGPIVGTPSYLGGAPHFVVPCPNGGKCGPISMLFSTPDKQACTGLTTCWIWFLERNHGTAALHSVQAVWAANSRVCTENCRTIARDEAGEKAAYQAALASWNELNMNGCANPKPSPIKMKPAWQSKTLWQ